MRSLASLVRVAELRPGDAVLRASEPANAIHLLVEGAVRIYYPATAEAGEVTVKLLGAPAAFGDAESILRTRWAETVEALTPAVALIADAGAYFQLLQREPSVCFRQYWDVARRFGIAIHTERAANFSPLLERVAMILLAYARQFGQDEPRGVLIDHPLTQDDLARQSGSNRRSIVRALADLYQHGALVRVGRRYLIPSRERLVAVATGTLPEIAFKTDDRPWAETRR